MIKKCIMMNVTVPKLECAGEVCEGNAKFVKKLRTECRWQQLKIC